MIKRTCGNCRFYRSIRKCAMGWPNVSPNKPACEFHRWRDGKWAGLCMAFSALGLVATRMAKYTSEGEQQ